MEQKNKAIPHVPSLDNELGTRIKAVCERLGSRKNAAEIGGVSEDMIYKYINGNTMPKLDVIARLCKEANISMQWLAYGEGPEESIHFKDWEPDAAHPLGQVATWLYETIHKAGKASIPPETFNELLVELYNTQLQDIPDDDPRWQQTKRLIEISLRAAPAKD